MSIVIPCHYRVDLLRECLASVRRHAPAAEVIVVDDASPTGCATAAAAEFPDVRSIRMDVRSGFCAAANAGLRAASRPVVELLNDDTEVTPGWAEAALGWFDDPAVGGVAPLVLCWPGHDLRIDSAGDRYFCGGVAGKRGRGETLGPAYLRPCRVFGASASSAFYRREAVLAAGAFPESFGAYFEDVDLAFRLHRAGFDVVYEPASWVLHHVGASHGRQGGELLAQQSRNEERVFWRNLPTPVLLRALPAHGALLAAKAWRRWREGALGPWLRGRLSVLAEVSELRRHRRQLGRAKDVGRWQMERDFWGGTR